MKGMRIIQSIQVIHIQDRSNRHMSEIVIAPGVRDNIKFLFLQVVDNFLVWIIEFLV